MADEYDITEQGSTRRRTPEELAELSANVALANERYRQSTLLAGRFEGGAPGAFEPGGTLYNAPGVDYGYASRGQARQDKIRQGDEKHTLEVDKQRALESNRDRTSGLNESKFAFEQAKFANTSRRERDIADQAADFLIAERDLDPSSPDYEAKTAALLKGRPYALAHPEVQGVLKMNTALRAEHAKLVNKGGAEEFSGPSSEAFHRVVNAGGSVEQARAHALSFQKGEDEVHKLVAEGHITPEDLAWGTEKDAAGNDVPLAQSKNKHFISDPNSPHYGEVDHAALAMTGNRRKGETAAATRAATLKTAGAADLKASFGITPEQLLNPLSVKAGKIGDDSQFTNAYPEADKGDVIQIDVGKKDPLIMKRPLYEQHKRAAILASKPKTLIQGGHTYTLGEDGQYH